MTGSSDIAKLFKSFGGNAAEEYREILDDDRQGASRARWPILEQIPVQAPTLHKPSPAVKAVDSPALGKPQPLPSFHSLRVLAPSADAQRHPIADDVSGAAAPAPAAPSNAPRQGAPLQEVFRRLGQPEPVAVQAAAAPSVQEAAPASGIASIFQRLRRS